MSLTQLQAHLIAVLTFAVGQVVAFVPSLAQNQADLISGGTTVIAAVIAVVSVAHRWLDGKPSPAPAPAPAAPAAPSA